MRIVTTPFLGKITMEFNDYFQKLLQTSDFYSIQGIEKHLILVMLELDGETGELTEILKKHFQIWMLDQELLTKKLRDILFFITLYAYLFRCHVEKYTNLQKEISELGNYYIIDNFKSSVENSYRSAAYLNALVQALPNPTDDDQIHDIKKAILDAFQSLVQALKELSQIRI